MEDAQVFAFVAFVITGMVAALCVIGVVTAKAVQRLRRNGRTVVAAPVAEERLEQLQQSIDAIAVEVERIAEAQRFTAKLLSERGERTPLPR